MFSLAMILSRYPQIAKHASVSQNGTDGPAASVRVDNTTQQPHDVNKVENEDFVRIFFQTDAVACGHM